MKRDITATFLSSIVSYRKAGISVQDALSIVSENERNKQMKNIALKILEQIKNGNSFSSAVQNCDECSELRIFGSFLQSSEEAGHLTDALSFISDYFSEKKKARDNFLSAALYPLCVLGVVAIVIMVITVYVFPKFAEILSVLNTEKSGFDIYSSVNSLKTVGVVFSFIVLLLVAFALLYRVNKSFKYLVDRLTYKIPFIKNVRVNSDLSGFCFLMSALLKGGEKTGHAIATAAESLGNLYFKSLMIRVRDRIVAGDGLFCAVKSERELPDIFCSMMKKAEETDILAVSFDNLYRVFSDNAKRKREAFAKISEPILTVITGLIVFVFVMKFALPMFTSFGELI